MEGRRETEIVRTNQQVQIDWSLINWAQIKHQVESLQQKIFRETQKSNFKKVKQYQKLFTRTLSARLWAVRLVTELNSGRNSPGADGRLFKTNVQKVKLVENLKLKNIKPNPVKVVWIPKPNGGKRKLGIPTIRDRAMQTLILLAMNPEWEAKFEPHSFGFRPGRSAIDTIHHISCTLMHQKNRRPHSGWIFDADITKCFDNIDHNALLVKLDGSPFKGIIRAWLKSGAVSQVGFERTKKGTPQGGVISPLLANIALDGMERQFRIYTRTGKYIPPSRRGGKNKDIALFRYADDFIILAPSKDILVNYVIPKIKAFLLQIGLELNKAKTRIVNLSEGFKFLGFTFRRFYRRNGDIKEFTYYPSRTRIDRFLVGLKKYVRFNYNVDVKVFISGLNRRIRGFCNYFKWSNAYKAFAYLSYRIWGLLWRWAQRRHPKRNRTWLVDHYWKTIGKSKWVFSYQGIHLVQPYELNVPWWRYPKVRIHTSPFDLTTAEYWKKRRETHRKSRS